MKIVTFLRQSMVPDFYYVEGVGIFREDPSDIIKWLDGHGIIPHSGHYVAGYPCYQIDGDLEVLFKLRWL